MEKRIKFIIIGFIIILGVSFFINLQTYTAKQTVVRERDAFKQENAALNTKIDELKNSLRDNENRLTTLNKELDRAAQEKDQIQKQMEILNKERQDLIDKLKQVSVRPVTVVEKEAPPVTEDAYWAGVLKEKNDLEMQLDSLRQDLKTAQLNNEQSQGEKSSLTLEVSSLNRHAQDLKRQLDYNQKLMDSLAQELVREKKDKLQINDTLKPIQSENEILRRQLKSINNRKINLERKITELEKEKGTLTNRLNEMTALLEERTLEAKESSVARPASESDKESVELPPIVVRPQTETPTDEEVISSSLGKILAINRDNNFVIVDLGEETGVKMGDTLEAYRQDSAIATLEVIQVRKDISACDIKKEITPLKVGDIVR